MNICESSSKLSSELLDPSDSEHENLKSRTETETTFQTLHFDQLERNNETIEINCGSVRSIASEMTESVILSDDKSEVHHDVPVGSSMNEGQLQKWSVDAPNDVWVTRDEMDNMLIIRDNQLVRLEAQIETLMLKPILHSAASQTDMSWEKCDSVEQRIEVNSQHIILREDGLKIN